MQEGPEKVTQLFIDFFITIFKLIIVNKFKQCLIWTYFIVDILDTLTNAKDASSDNLQSLYHIDKKKEKQCLM